jgi:uroporphyrin-III C-methyltransferase/precorrin-2 dehydrogenase/sirohydrochlorin ferrochelatase
MKNNTLPVLLTNPYILLLGAGAVALQKALVMRENGINFKVIARDCSSAFIQHNIPVDRKEIQISDLDNFLIVVDATGDEQIGMMLKRVKASRHVLVNRVDRPDECDFYFSALLRYGPLKVAVSSDGASPVASQIVRDKIKRMLPHEIGDTLSAIAVERQNGVINPQNIRETIKCHLAHVFLLGCGPGDPDLLTLQAYKCLHQVDVVLYDHLISHEILELVPQNTVKHYVGKEKGHHSYTQEQINDLILKYIRQGVSVARLKSGDPYVFGRGAEELAYLLDAGVKVTLVPGISSATAGPALAGIPLTARGYATSFSVVSAHLAGSKFNTSWIPLLLQRKHTIVVLMGLSFATKIKEAAIEAGVDLEIPVAIISNATRTNQKVSIADIKTLDSACTEMDKPAIMVFGSVVELYAVLGA